MIERTVVVAAYVAFIYWGLLQKGQIEGIDFPPSEVANICKVLQEHAEAGGDPVTDEEFNEMVERFKMIYPGMRLTRLGSFRAATGGACEVLGEG